VFKIDLPSIKLPEPKKEEAKPLFSIGAIGPTVIKSHPVATPTVVKPTFTLPATVAQGKAGTGSFPAPPIKPPAPAQTAPRKVTQPEPRPPQPIHQNRPTSASEKAPAYKSQGLKVGNWVKSDSISEDGASVYNATVSEHGIEIIMHVVEYKSNRYFNSIFIMGDTITGICQIKLKESSTFGGACCVCREGIANVVTLLQKLSTLAEPPCGNNP